jgi:hypothetical protein
MAIQYERLGNFRITERGLCWLFVFWCSVAVIVKIYNGSGFGDWAWPISAGMMCLINLKNIQHNGECKMLIDHEEIIEICDMLITTDESMMKVCVDQYDFDGAARWQAQIRSHRAMKFHLRELVKKKKEAEFQPFTQTVTGENINTEA